MKPQLRDPMSLSNAFTTAGNLCGSANEKNRVVYTICMSTFTLLVKKHRQEMVFSIQNQAVDECYWSDGDATATAVERDTA